MPLIRVDIVKGKSPEYKKILLDCLHEGMMETLGIEDWDRFQRIIEIDKENFEIPSGKTENFTIIEITMFQGRSKEQKRALIEIITKKLGERLEMISTDVFIIINEPPNENWGLGGKQKG